MVSIDTLSDDFYTVGCFNNLDENASMVPCIVAHLFWTNLKNV